MSTVPSPQEIAAAGLLHVSDNMPGIKRVKVEDRFEYVGADGEPVVSEETIARIRSLAIPPAYTHVWICPFARGHLQATGRDAKGRKQYRYHPDWIALANGNKFAHMTAFGAALPKIRQTVDRDIGRHDLTKEKVLATVVWFLDATLIRIGSEEYVEQNQSYGLTTMRTRHCKVGSAVVEFHFVGKKGIKHDIRLADRRMARVVKRIQELPGQELFQYLDSEGQARPISSSEVNDYLREITSLDVTAKDFRTWAGTVAAVQALSEQLHLRGREAKRAISATMKAVAAQLHNTPAVCRKSYVHPGVVECYLAGALGDLLRAPRRVTPSEWLHEDELRTLSFLIGLEAEAHAA